MSDDDDRARWSRLIMFTLALVLFVTLVLWWTGWFTISFAAPPVPGAD